MDLDRALAFSRYAQRTLAAEPALRPWLEARLDAPFDWPAELPALEAAAAGDAAEALAGALRACRRRVMLHTLARDLTGRGDLLEVCAAVTRLAETAIDAACRFHHRRLADETGEPVGAESGAPQRLVVVGMGKLGGGELNVSSDVDLVFVYPEEGETRGPRRLSNREFFERLGRRVIAALHEVTAQGYVFRVDMRLRPYGDSGPLAVPFGALEQYLLTQGRAWERYAWLKARPLTGDAHDDLAAIVDPFVFRKYLDYDAYAGLRNVHRQIREQGARRDYARNVKLGEGGIREVEFIVQAIQIVRGGREAPLRLRGTLPALAAIEARGHLPGRVCERLREAYTWLRNVEHRLQYRDDQQTQDLPADADERLALAQACGLDLAGFDARTHAVRTDVVEHFVAVLGAAPEEEDEGPLAPVWHDPDLPSSAEALAAAGYGKPADVLSRLRGTRDGLRYQQLPALSRERFDTLVPRLLDAAARSRFEGHEPDAVFGRLMELLETVSRRSAYLALLIEHPPLLPRLANLMGASAWAADFLTRRPILLDELLDARLLFAEADWDTWRAELDEQLAAAGDDPERQMDALRHFQHAQVFRLLVQDLAGQLTVERLADHLSALADVVIAAALRQCWLQMRGADAAPPRFAVAGYGKLGGKELGYASDLDLVFLYDVDEREPEADELPARYARLGQRLVTWLTATTAAGQLYETDLRLRPDGAAGLIVSSVAAFRRYQREKAWTWEHQALTRARFVAGDPDIGAAFESERDAILRLPREPAKLAADVLAMRRRMHDGHPNATGRFDLKHDEGGMVDVEFAVQYLVLAHAHAHPGLTRNAGNIALLLMAGDLGLVPPALAREVADAYRAYRRRQHAVRLTGAAHARVDAAAHAARRAAVRTLWAHVFGNGTPAAA
ncbi:MAG TPA: bifunctional [glutamate--ammonia ligase]-adenylyl-L-tyrosine phosphorylase/[glutamate--ammonia-ligase] adenylyltransferase [Casimicrobiaceae bacterium]|nr:bifunctional [glutamate--ammonia ligase]-adenylyl-L-tyrosine phosphorylase/[glutamate--ammonia-ligase] adenylyltransferase [Casimicrobiaceae bacterium]